MKRLSFVTVAAAGAVAACLAAAALVPLPVAAATPASYAQAAPPVAQPDAQPDAAIPVDLEVAAALVGEIGSNIDTEFTTMVMNDDAAHAAAAARLIVTLPAGASLVRAYNDGGDVPPDSNVGGVLTFQLGTLAPQSGR